MITSLILTAFFGLTGYILQSYIYRSYNQEIPTNNEQVIDLTKYNTLDTLKLEIDEANVYVKEVLNNTTSELVNKAFVGFDFNGTLMEFQVKVNASDIFILSLASSLE